MSRSRARTYYGVIYPPEDFSQVVRVGEVTPLIGPGFRTSDDAEGQVCEEWADIQDQGWASSGRRASNPRTRGRTLGAFIIEVDSDGVVSDWYSFKPNAKRRKANPSKRRKIRKGGLTYRAANPGGRFAGMVPFFIDMGDGKSQSGFEMPDLPEFKVTPDEGDDDDAEGSTHAPSAAEYQARKDAHARHAAVEEKRKARFDSASPEIKREVAKTRKGGLIPPIYPERQDLRVALDLLQGDRDSGAWAQRDNLEALSEIYGIKLQESETYEDIKSNKREFSRAVRRAVKAYADQFSSEEQEDALQEGPPTAEDLYAPDLTETEDALAEVAKYRDEEEDDFEDALAEVAKYRDEEDALAEVAKYRESSRRGSESREQSRPGVQKAKDAYTEGLEKPDVSFIRSRLKDRLVLSAFQDRYRDEPSALAWDLGIWTPPAGEVVYEFAAPPELVEKYLVRKHHYDKSEWLDNGRIIPDVAAFISKELRQLATKAQAGGKSLRELEDQVTSRASSGGRKRRGGPRRDRLTERVEAAALRGLGDQEAREWQEAGADVSLDDVIIDKGDVQILGIDDSEEGLRERFGDEGYETLALLSEEAVSRGFELAPVQVMLALRAREGMRESLENGTWFQQFPELKKGDSSRDDEYRGLIKGLLDRVGGLGDRY